jgi:drug/metabolite transporter (DMT)-like permease
MLTGLLAALVASVTYGTSSVLQAYGARRSATAARARGAVGQFTATGAPTMISTVAAVLTLWFIIGSVLDIIGFAGGALAARLLPLFLCQTIISANLIVTALLGTVVLGIRLHGRDWAAIATVILALVALSFSAGSEGHGDGNAATHWGLLIACAGILLLGLLTVRRMGSAGAIAAGLIAGLLFGGLAIAVRIVDGVDPVEWSKMVADPAAWTIALAGIGGFYLHTVALQLGSVNGATAALVAGETVVPGIVGVLLLGDTSRHGMEWLALLGFILAVGGAVAVAIFGSAEATKSLEQTVNPGAPGPLSVQ